MSNVNNHFIPYQLKKDIVLVNGENTSEWEDYIRVTAGETIGLRMHRYEDGRTYYSYFKEQGGKFYTNTLMFRKDGSYELGCGGLLASEEIRKHFEKIGIHNLPY